MFVDEEYNISIWTCKLFPLVLHKFNANIENKKQDSKIIL
jgi:hypothetical protein